jgi:hypothetical protein
MESTERAGRDSRPQTYREVQIGQDIEPYYRFMKPELCSELWSRRSIICAKCHGLEHLRRILGI